MTPRPVRSDAVILVVCALAIFADVVITGAVIPNIPVFAERFGVRELELGVATSAFSIVFLATVVPYGVVVDRTGRNGLVILVAMVFQASSGLLFAFGESISAYAFAQGLHGAGSAGAWVGAQPVAARIVAGRRRKGLLMSSITIAMGFGLIIGPLFGSLSPAWLPFVVLSGVALGVGAAALRTLTDVRAEVTLSLTGYIGFLRDRAILAAAVLVLLIYAAKSMLEIIFPLYADEVGLSKAAIGVLFFVNAVFLTAAQPLTAPLLIRWPRGRLESVALLAMAAGVAALALTESYSWWIGLFVVVGVLIGVLVSASMLVIVAESPPSARGGAFALWNIAFAVGFLIGPLLGGALSQLAGDGASTERFHLPLLSYGAFLALAAPATWFALRRLPKPEKKSGNSTGRRPPR